MYLHVPTCTYNQLRSLYRSTTTTDSNGTYIKEVLLPAQLYKYLYAVPLNSYLF